MDNALVRCAVTKKAHDDFLRASDLGRKRRSRSGGYRGADCSSIAEKPERHVAHVHFAAAPLGISVRAPHALAQELVKIRPFGDQMTRPAMVTGNEIR